MLFQGVIDLRHDHHDNYVRWPGIMHAYAGRFLQGVSEKDIPADTALRQPQNSNYRDPVKDSQEPQACLGSSHSGRSSPNQVEKKGGDTEIESSPSPLSRAACPHPARPCAANLPTKHGQAERRPQTAPTPLKQPSARAGKAPRPQSAPAKLCPPSRIRLLNHQRAPASSEGPEHAKPRMLPSGPGRPHATAGNAHVMATSPEAWQKGTAGAQQKSEGPFAQLSSNARPMPSSTGGKQLANGAIAVRPALAKSNGTHLHNISRTGCKDRVDREPSKPAPAARPSHALVPSDCFEGVSMA